MGAPSINITFIEKAKATVKRGERGVIAMIVRGTKQATYTLLPGDSIPSDLTEDAQEQIALAFEGYQTAPKKILVYVTAETEYDEALDYLASQKFDWLVAPSAETDKQTDTIVNWIKEQRDTYGRTYKAVLSNTAADSEAIVNVTNGYTYAGGTLTAEKACARVAGIICGTTTYRSCTYAPISEATDCDRMTTAELDAAVDAGKLVFMWDGEKVKICRGVTSFATTTDTKGDAFKKIRLVEFMDMIKDDIRQTAQDSFIGKYPNDYDSKCVLITAINDYFNELVREKAITAGSCEIDTDVVTSYIKTKKDGNFYVDGELVSIEDATDQQIKQADTGAGVYLLSRVTLLDALEDIYLENYIV
jgi:hypothetical protein